MAKAFRRDDGITRREAAFYQINHPDHPMKSRLLLIILNLVQASSQAGTHPASVHFKTAEDAFAIAKAAHEKAAGEADESARVILDFVLRERVRVAETALKNARDELQSFQHRLAEGVHTGTAELATLLIAELEALSEDVTLEVLSEILLHLAALEIITGDDDLFSACKVLTYVALAALKRAGF